MSSEGRGFLILGIVLIVLGAIGLILPLVSSLPGEFALGGIISLLVGLVFAGSGVFLGARKRREAAILQDGIPGQATLVNWWIIGKSGGELDAVEYCEFELDVSVAGKPPYRVKHRQLVPFGVYHQLSRGMILPVKVHPEQPKRLILDWDQQGEQVTTGTVLPAGLGAVLAKMASTAEQGSLKDRLQQLQEAYNAGLISAEEFESKKAAILKEL